MKKLLIVLFLISIFVCGCEVEEKTQVKPEKQIEKPTEVKKILMVIAPNNFKDEEYFIPKEIFQKEGFVVKTASLNKIAISVEGKKVDADFTIDDIKFDFDAIVFSGGPGAAVYFNNEKLFEIVRRSYNEGKIIGAICIAPSILANSGILKGKKATSFKSEESNLKQNGAIYIDEGVVVDGNIITANGPKASEEFANKIVEALR